ncbi:RNA-directed DNA polymerase, eukaryota [Tanacetum coccineum]
MKSLDTGKLYTSSEVTQPKTELYLDELTNGASGTIIVIICRSWDVHTITGRYLSTDFVISDAKGNAIHSTAKANVARNFLKLKEGSVYSIKNFVVQANKEECRIFRDHAYMIELDGATSVRKTSVKGGGFVRYPFQLKEFGSIELTNNKYLIDVAGYVTNVSRITQQKSGSRTLDFSLANGSKDEVSLSQAAVHADYSQAKEGTLENLLIWAQNRKIILRPSNVELRLMASRHERDETSHPVVYPMLRFRLELDVSDKTASTVVVMFDEPVTELVKCSTDSLMAADEDVGLAYVDDVAFPQALANIIEEVVEEDVGSSNINTSAEVNIKEFQKMATKPSVVTSSKPAEERGKIVSVHLYITRPYEH